VVQELQLKLLLVVDTAVLLVTVALADLAVEQQLQEDQLFLAVQEHQDKDLLEVTIR
jgi:hypothetical protein